MTQITNFDTRISREARIITTSDNELNWCIAVWPAPEYGHTKVTGEGHGWQIVRRQKDGRYTYNDEMLGGFADSLDDLKTRIVAKHKYTLLDEVQ